MDVMNTARKDRGPVRLNREPAPETYEVNGSTRG